MTDVAALGFAIDSGPIATAIPQLDRLTAAAKKAEDAAAGVSGSNKDAADNLRRMASAIAAIDGPLGGVASRFRSLGSLIDETSLAAVAISVTLGAAVLAAKRFVLEFADSWSDLNARVGLAIGNMDASGVVLDRLATVARRTYSSLENTAESYLRNATTLRELGKSTSQQLDFTEALNNALVVSGAKAERAAMVQEALGRAMALGALRGQELNTVIQTGGRVSEVIAEQLGVGVNQLRRLGEQGKITGDVIYTALTSRMEQLRGEADRMPATIGDAFTILRNSAMQLVGVYDQNNKLSERVAAGIIGIADSLNVMARAAVVAGTAMTLAFGGTIVSSIRALALAISVGAVNAFRALTVAAMTNPIGILAVVIGTVVAALYQFQDASVQIGNSTVGVGKVLDATWVTVKETFFAVVGVVGSLASAMWSLVSGRWSEAVETARKAWDGVAGSVERTRDAWNSIDVSRFNFAANLPKDAHILDVPGPGKADPNANADVTAYDKRVKSIERHVAAMKIDAATYGLSETAAAKLRLQMELLNAAKEAGMAITPALIDSHRQLAEAMGLVTSELERQKIERTLMTPDEVFAEQIGRLKELYGEDAENFRAYQAMKAQYELERLDGIRSATQTETDMRRKTVEMSVDLLQRLGQQNKTAAIAAIVLNKALAAAMIIQDTARAAMAAAAASAIFGPVAAAGAASSMWALGAAQLAIVAATGGLEIASVLKGGGSSGGATASSSSSSGGSSSSLQTGSSNDKVVGQGTTIIIQGDKVSYRELEELARQLNDLGGDGGPITVKQGTGW